MATADSVKAKLQGQIDKINAATGGTYATLADAVDTVIAGFGQGGSQAPVSSKAVNFRDYDGTPLYSYTAEEALALSELPPLPSRDGLICQEWNWSLADMQEYVAEYGVCEIGATYITDDGKTRLHITIAAEGRMNVPLYISQTVAHGVTIDWGDGSAAETLPGTGNVNTTHTYASIGDYVIALDVEDGCVLGLGHNRSGINITGTATGMNRGYASMIRAVFVGKNVTRIGNYVFYYCHSIQNVTIPKEVTSIETYVFCFCYNLSYLVIPKWIVTINGETFYTCTLLRNISIPSTVTTIGNGAFNTCYSLSSIVIPKNVKNIGANAFYQCYNFANVVIPNGVTDIASNLFYNNRRLLKIDIPYGVTTINSSAFYYCHSLVNVSIPNTVTSIGNSAFYACVSLSSIYIPGSVKSIDASAFNDCRAIAFYDFTEHTSVPALANSNAFTGMSADCEIRVPAALVAEWKAATNWSAVADNIVGV